MLYNVCSIKLREAAKSKKLICTLEYGYFDMSS